MEGINTNTRNNITFNTADSIFPCLICHDGSFKEFKVVIVTTCCKKLLHSHCAARWVDSAAANQNKKACIYCRNEPVTYVNLNTIVYQGNKISEYLDDEDQSNALQTIIDNHSSVRSNEPDSRAVKIPTIDTIIQRSNLQSSNSINSSNLMDELKIESFPVQVCTMGDSKLLAKIIENDQTFVYKRVESIKHNDAMPLFFLSAINYRKECIKILAEAEYRDNKYQTTESIWSFKEKKL